MKNLNHEMLLYLVDGILLLLTVEDIVDNAPMLVADFRDSLALAHKESGKFVGFDNKGILRLGDRPYLANGIWYIHEHIKSREKYENVPLVPSILEFKKV